MNVTDTSTPATPVVSIVIGGGLNNCTSSDGWAGGKWALANWATILREDPAFQGMDAEAVQFERRSPVQDWRYRLSAHALERLLAAPAPLLGDAMRRVLTCLREQEDDETELSFAALQQRVASAHGAVCPAGELSASDWAVLRSVLVVTPAAAHRQQELRSVAFLSDPHSRQIYRAVVAAACQAGQCDRPRIGVLTSASEDPFADADIHVSALRSAGADSVYIPLNGGWRQAMDTGCPDWLDQSYEWYAHQGSEFVHAHSVLRYPDHAAWQRALAERQGAPMLALLQSLDGLFLAGGDQARHLEALASRVPGTTAYDPSPELRLISERHAEGRLVVAGTSAGNHIQGGGMWCNRPVPMIAGGDSYPALQAGFRQAMGARQEAPVAPTLYAHGGLGTFPYGLLDSHFSQRCREGRLLVACVHSLVHYGFGIDENTALLVCQPDALGKVTMRVMGEHGVWVVDLRGCTPVISVDAGLQVSGVRTHYLRDGDTLVLDVRGDLHVHLNDHAGAPPVDESLCIDDWTAVQAYGSGRFAALCQRMCETGAAVAQGTTQHSDDGRSNQDQPPWRVELSRRRDTRCALSDGRASYTNLYLAVHPVQTVTLAA